MKRAVFVLAPAWDGFAAVSRTKGEALGLPGGKVDQGETSLQALHRECLEEGWCLVGEVKFLCSGTVDEYFVEWYQSEGAVIMDPNPNDNSAPMIANIKDIVFLDGEIHPYQKPLAIALGYHTPMYSYDEDGYDGE